MSPRCARARFLLVIVLILGQLLLPAMAAACSAGDAVAGQDSAQSDVADLDDAADCCDNAGCSDCCLHAGGAPIALQKTAPVLFARTAPVPRRVSVPPGDYPVEFRPPIAK